MYVALSDPAGTLNVTPVKLPSASVVTVAGVVLRAVGPNLNVIVFDGAKFVPDAMTCAPTIPLVEFSESIGVTPTMNGEVGELEPSYASMVLSLLAGGTEIVLLPPVDTVVAKSSALPVMFVLAPIVIPELSISVPTKTSCAASVVAAPGVQNTPEACAPPDNTTLVLAAWFSAPVLLKTCAPLPVSVIGPEPMLSAPVTQYTPGGYTLVGNSTLDPRSIAPGGNVTVHASAFNAGKARP
jgi:hypothetical protein